MSKVLSVHNLANLIAERIAAGLKRKTLTTCSKWAEAYRIMGKPFPGPWKFKYHPWLKEMHDSTAELNVGKKAAQVGFTETLLNISFFHIDVKDVDVLYVLPAKTPDASDFSTGRFDPALEMSPHLMNLFSDVKNIGHKRAGHTNLYIRGSKSRAGLKSIPVGLVILDEVDEMEQENIPLAFERSGGQMEKLSWAVSTPTLPKVGIDKLYQDTTQEHFFFKCPCCSRLIEMTFPNCLEITGEDVNDPNLDNSFLKCDTCKGKLNHETKIDWLSTGRWIPSYTNRASRGFHVPQLYSSARPARPSEIAKHYLRSLRDPTEEQEFFNSKLGLEHIVEGAAITDADLDQCTTSYRTYTHSSSHLVTTMGIDVGKWLHYEIDQWNIPDGANITDINVMARCKVLRADKVLNFEELDDLVRRFYVNHVVIDANPERRKAFEFAQRFYGFVKMCFYGMGVNGKQIHIGKDEEPTITVDRTSWLDLSLGRFRNTTINLPFDISQEYKSNIKSLIRIYSRDKFGNPIGRYEKGNEPDHFAHARNYAEIALPFALDLATSEDISESVL